MIKVAVVNALPPPMDFVEEVVGGICRTAGAISAPGSIVGVNLRSLMDAAPAGIRSWWHAMAIQVAWAQSDFPQSLDVFMSALRLRMPTAMNIATASRLHYTERLAETDLAFIRMSDWRVWGFAELRADEFHRVISMCGLVAICSLGMMGDAEMWAPPAAGATQQRIACLRRLIAAYKAGKTVYRVKMPGQRQALAVGRDDLMERFGHLMSPPQHRRWSAADACLE